MSDSNTPQKQKQKSYVVTEDGIVIRDRRQLTHGAIVPNYVVDLYLPIIGYDGLGILTSIYRRANGDGEIIGGLAESAKWGRMGAGTYNDRLELLKECKLITITKPSGKQRLAHFRTEICILDAPTKVPAKFVDEILKRSMTSWLMDKSQINTPEYLNRLSGLSDQNFRREDSDTPKNVPIGVVTIDDDSLFSETENPNNNPSLAENESQTDSPVLLPQTGVETKQAESITLITETSEIKQSTVEQTNRGVETDSGDQPTRKDHSAPRRGPGRPRKDAQTAMPLGCDTRAVDAPKPRRQGNTRPQPKRTPEEHELVNQYYAMMVAARGEAYDPAGDFPKAVKQECWSKLFPYQMAPEDVYNLYKIIEHEGYMTENEIMPRHIAKKYEKWRMNGKKIPSGVKRYVNPSATSTPPKAPARQSSSMDASMSFWTGEETRPVIDVSMDETHAF